MAIPTLVLGLAAAGALGGLLAGLLGVGGGIVIVPALFALFSVLELDPAVRMPLAVGTSLSTIIVTAIVSWRAHARRDSVDASLLRSFSPWIVVGVAIGAAVAGYAPPGVLEFVFAGVALTVALYMGLAPRGVLLARHVPSGPVRWTIAVLIGGVSSIMGLGGGTLGVPTLTLMNVPVRRAVGTAAAFGAIIAVPATLSMASVGWKAPNLPPGSIGYVNVLGFAVLVPMTTLMAPLGARLAHSLPPMLLQRLFALFLLVTSVRMFVARLAVA